MAKREWRLFLQDILDSMDRVVDYTLGMNRESFLKDAKTYDAVIRNLEIIRTAYQYLSEKVKTLYPDVDWKSIQGLSRIGSRVYFQINPDRVWENIHFEIPELRPEVEKILLERKESSEEIEV